MKDVRITARVTEREQQRIAALAKSCGLSQTEYIRQRTLGYEPRTVLPDAFFIFCEKADELIDRGFSPEVNAAVLSLLKTVEQELIVPGKDVTTWQPPDSGQSKVN